MVMCAVFGCNNSGRHTANQGIRLFSFPKDAEYKKRWVNACRRSDKFNIKCAKICSIHFTKEDYYKPLKYSMLKYSPKNRRSLKDTAIPSQNMPNQQITEENVTKKISERANRNTKRNQSKIAKDLLKSFNENAAKKLCTNDNLNNEIETFSKMEDDVLLDVPPILEPHKLCVNDGNSNNVIDTSSIMEDCAPIFEPNKLCVNDDNLSNEIETSKMEDCVPIFEPNKLCVNDSNLSNEIETSSKMEDCASIDVTAIFESHKNSVLDVLTKKDLEIKKLKNQLVKSKVLRMKNKMAKKTKFKKLQNENVALKH